jgi:hypothetical protein
MQKAFTKMYLFSIVDGRLSLDGMDSVYDILNHVCDTKLITPHLPVAFDYLKLKNPNWFVEEKNLLQTIKDKIGNDFNILMNYIKANNFEVKIPQLKDEFDTSDFGNYMINNSLLLKKLK